LYGARALAQWVRQGGTPERPMRAHALRLWWHAWWFEQNWRTQSTRLASLPMPQDPVFILGLWRSGTTVLHELLASATGWRTPQTWQCFAPSTCFLTSAPTTQSSAARPMDQGHITTHGPQEDEFALLLLGEPSLYRGFIDPRRLLECTHEGVLSAGSVPPAAHEPAALPRWQTFICGLASQAPQQRLLLKSPNHSFRLPLLRALFPRARYVWIGRHTGEVLSSNLKMWRAMMQLYGLWHCPTGTLEAFLQAMLSAAADVLDRCLEEMPPEQLLCIDFEQLRTEPARTLERTLDFVGTGSLSAGEAQRRLQEALTRVPVHAGGRSDMPDIAPVQRLERLRAAARQRFGGLADKRGAAVTVAPPGDPR
jgi:hypothetical protein